MGAAQADQLPLRDDHDPLRPAVATSQAAEVLQQSRFHVSELVKAGELEGYGIRANERTRWFVYVDALQSRTGPDAVRGDGLVPKLRAVRDKAISVQKQRRESREALLSAYDSATYADDSPQLREVMRCINDSERRNFRLDHDLTEIITDLVALVDRLTDSSPP